MSKKSSRNNSERDRKEHRNISTENKKDLNQPSSVQKIFVDDMGRIVDEKGNIIPKVT